MKKELINKKVMEKIIADSPLCQHAIKELRLAGYTPDGDEPNTWMYNQVMEAVAVFSSHGHSGFSAPFEINIVKKLCNWEVLSPLTFKDDEWTQISADGEMQNKRKGSIFKEADGRIIDIDAYRCKPINTWRYGADDWEKNDKGICWTGELFETYPMFDKNGKLRVFLTGRCFNRCCIKYDAEKGYVPKSEMTIPCDEIEISPDNWILTVEKTSKDLIRLSEEYEILWGNCNILKDMDVTEITEEIMHKADEESKNNKC